MWAQIRLLLQGQSDLGLHHLTKRLRKQFSRRQKQAAFALSYCSRWQILISLRIFGKIRLDISCKFLLPMIHMKYKTLLTLNAPIATKVVCFSRLLKCLSSLYGKQCGPRSDCYYRSSLFWVHAVCFYT